VIVVQKLYLGIISKSWIQKWQCGREVKDAETFASWGVGLSQI
jgi:hypothetical protein